MIHVKTYQTIAEETADRTSYSPHYHVCKEDNHIYIYDGDEPNIPLAFTNRDGKCVEQFVCDYSLLDKNRL